MFSDRAIYQYPAPDGVPRYADPVAAWRRLLVACDGDVNTPVERQRADDWRAKAGAEEVLWPAVRLAFDLPDFDPATGGGADDGYCCTLLNHFFGWLEQKKNDTAADADVIAVAGWPPGQRVTYADWVGVWLNLSRESLRVAQTLARAIKAAGDDDPLGDDWYTAMADCEEQAARLQAEGERDRMMARVYRKHG